MKLTTLEIVHATAEVGEAAETWMISIVGLTKRTIQFSKLGGEYLMRKRQPFKLLKDFTKVLSTIVPILGCQEIREE